MTIEASGNGYKFDESAGTINPVSPDDVIDGLLNAISKASSAMDGKAAMEKVEGAEDFLAIVDGADLE